MGFLILILKCNRDTEMMKQIIDSNTEKARNKERERKKGKERKRREKKKKKCL